MSNDDLARKVAADFPRLQGILEDLVRIPSVSAPGFDPADVERSAVAVARLLDEAGMESRLLTVDGAHPAAFGQLQGPDGAPTMLLYAHHDVQPPGPAGEWATSPFEPTVSDGRLYGRGASDDKAGIVMHLGALAAHDGAPPLTVKVFAEGEEEISSAHMPEYLDAYGDLLQADMIVIADVGNVKTGVPTLTTSLRGLADCVVEVRVLDKAVHSGDGGVVPDALMAMSRLLASLHDDDGTVAVPGRVRRDIDFDLISEDDYRADHAVRDGVETIGHGTVASRIWLQPSISILALDAPPVAEAINQLVPVARAKVSMRLAPGDDAAAATRALVEHLQAHAPWGVEVDIRPGAPGQPMKLATSGSAYAAYRTAFQEVWGAPTVEAGSGGTIPFVAELAARYPHASILLTGAGDHRSSPHAPNESVSLDELQRATLAEAFALRLLAE